MRTMRSCPRLRVSLLLAFATAAGVCCSSAPPVAAGPDDSASPLSVPPPVADTGAAQASFPWSDVPALPSARSTDRVARLVTPRGHADPQHAPSWNLLGSALGSTNASADEIRHAFARAIEADPSDPTAYVNLGTLELSSGRAALAANWFAQALTVSPGHEGARQGLAAARSAPQ